MKSTGIIRKVDELGRIVLPIELRRTLEITQGHSLEIYVEEESIILKKHNPSCVFCKSDKGLVEFLGRPVCEKCYGVINGKHS